mmetsp:Transcript_20641/g.36643  ORF Transcript_20641/g.36643 Transcript_20641/m.36643 type:complete len:473 (+) Transcript_20641:27-1445(+)
MDVAGLLQYLRLQRADVVDKALDITLGMTPQADFQAAWGKLPGATEHLISLACSRQNPEISMKASKCLVNLSEDPHIRRIIRDAKGVKLCMGKLRDSSSKKQHLLYVSLLANLTQDKAACEELVNTDDGKHADFFFDLYVLSADHADTEQTFQFGAYVLTNITQYDFGRKWLVEGSRSGKKKRCRCMCAPRFKRMNVRDAPDGEPSGNFLYHGDIVEVEEEKDGWIRHSKGWTARDWDGKQIMFPYNNNLTVLVAFTNSTNQIRRLATFQTIRNCALDKSVMGNMTLAGNDLLERLMLPLVVPARYGDMDRKGMLAKVIIKNDILHKNELKHGKQSAPDLKNHDNNSATVEEVPVKAAILETLLQFVRDDKLRKLLDHKRTYIILRELHEVEIVKELEELIIHIQNFFILDKKCLQQPRADDEGTKVKVENEVWSSPTGPVWNGPVDFKKKLQISSDTSGTVENTSAPPKEA